MRKSLLERALSVCCKVRLRQPLHKLEELSGKNFPVHVAIERFEAIQSQGEFFATDHLSSVADHGSQGEPIVKRRV